MTARRPPTPPAAAGRVQGSRLAIWGLTGALVVLGLLGLLGVVGPSSSPKPAAQAAQGGSQGGDQAGQPAPVAGADSTGDDPMLVAAGDIASCENAGDSATAALLDRIVAGGMSGPVVTLGDNAYESGTAREFADCYAPTWGRYKSRTRPTPGNHEYVTASAAGYYAYFGAAAGDPTRGYYSYDLGQWHLVALNSNCAPVGGCGTGSPQERWLRADLAAHPTSCTLAYWHHPRFSSGEHGNSTEVQPLWQALYDARADVVLNGHDHDYERFAPQTPDGTADPARGIREFVVGTGGRSHYDVTVVQPNSEVRNNNTFGVLQMTLHPASYDWQFIPEAGKSFADAGRNVSCH